MTYDFKDMAIRNMVMQEHQPTEILVAEKTRYEFGSQPLCKACMESWPCAPTLLLREYDEEQQKAHYVKMAEGGYRSELSPW